MKNLSKLRITSALTAFLTAAVVFTGCSADSKMSSGEYARFDVYAKKAAEDMLFDPSLNEEYAPIIENDFVSVAENAFSTFSADVDTASYTNLRRMINYGYSIDDIPANSVRTEEILNYFKFGYNLPNENEPFGVTAKIADCPWNPDSKLAIFGFRTEDIKYEDNDKPSNLVFLIDVSGSMNSDDKLPLLKTAFTSLTENLTKNDRVSIVTYSGKEKVVLKGCPGNDLNKILDAIDSLTASGSTNGHAGLEMAYSLAEDYFIKGGNNRIIMASDGDLNVGISSADELTKYVTEKRESGIYLSVLGFGTGNYKDARMEALADNGNGNYYYIDSEREGRRVLGEGLNATINTVADDVKFQIDFNHNFVSDFRLIGYENRVLNTEDFNDDTKDAGEVGSGHILTVAYEIILTDAALDDESELMTLSVRYKNPGEANSNLLEYPIKADALINEADDDFLFATALIEFSMVVRGSKYTGGKTLETVQSLLGDINLDDEYKTEFKSLVSKLIENSKGKVARDAESEPDGEITSRYE